MRRPGPQNAETGRAALRWQCRRFSVRIAKKLSPERRFRVCPPAQQSPALRFGLRMVAG